MALLKKPFQLYPFSLYSRFHLVILDHPIVLICFLPGPFKIPFYGSFSKHFQQRAYVITPLSFRVENLSIVPTPAPRMIQRYKRFRYTLETFREVLRASRPPLITS